MSNPFKTQFNSRCAKCEELVCEGEPMYAIDSFFVCEYCVPSENVCDCGNFKQEQYETCFNCKENRTESFDGHNLTKL